jgi:NADH:ubiquinone oxidoreductase subunit E
MCVGSNCSVNGNTRLSSKLKKYLKESGLSQQVKIKFQPCSDCCDDGPVVVFENQHYYQQSFDDLKLLINQKIQDN